MFAIMFAMQEPFNSGQEEPPLTVDEVPNTPHSHLSQTDLLAPPSATNYSSTQTDLFLQDRTNVPLSWILCQRFLLPSILPLVKVQLSLVQWHQCHYYLHRLSDESLDPFQNCEPMKRNLNICHKSVQCLSFGMMEGIESLL